MTFTTGEFDVITSCMSVAFFLAMFTTGITKINATDAQRVKPYIIYVLICDLLQPRGQNHRPARKTGNHGELDGIEN